MNYELQNKLSNIATVIAVIIGGAFAISLLMVFFVMTLAIVEGFFFGSHNCFYYTCTTNSQHLSGSVRVKP